MYDAVQFRTELTARHGDLKTASEKLQSHLRFILKDARVFFHAVATRPKSVNSAVRKLRDKQYEQPWTEMMDLVGGRVFTYFRQDSLLVEDVLRNYFKVDEDNSANKADGLEYNTFGYTSRHLVLRVDSSKTQHLELCSLLADIAFEIQIRTVLEHAWAEIEHELVYKARTKPPKEIRRRFAASAASIEMVEREFATLRDFEPVLVRDRIDRWSQTVEEPLDRAWMMAVLESHYPDRETWSPDPSSNVFYGGIETLVLEYLRSCGVSTTLSFDELAASEPVGRILARYSLSRGLESSKLSHLVVALACCAVRAEGSIPPDLLEPFDRELLQAVREEFVESPGGEEPE